MIVQANQSKSMRDSVLGEQGMSREIERDAVVPAGAAPVPDEDLSDFEGESQSEDEAKIDLVFALCQKEQDARICFVRRAIEQHLEQRALNLELNYLDLELKQ